MQGIGYRLGLAGVVLLSAVALRVLPPPWQGGAAGWLSGLWFGCALAAALGYWYKLDQIRDVARHRRLLEEARRRSKIRQQARG